jgi:2-polyprenyl-3-methyl-5-hydroxy-6-metoxy-1,4-benzoquinol methylase
MSFITQTRFPKLWLFMQMTIGGCMDKRAMALFHYNNEKTILEIGCSVGNVSEAFIGFDKIEFTGIDIDDKALQYAKSRFSARHNFKFLNISLEEMAASGNQYEYILFAGILHHVDNQNAMKLLSDSMKCLSKNGKIIISEPEKPRVDDSKVIHLFMQFFEQGSYLRTKKELEKLVFDSGIKLESSKDRMVSSGILKKPYVARFNLLLGKK